MGSGRSKTKCPAVKQNSNAVMPCITQVQPCNMSPCLPPCPPSFQCLPFPPCPLPQCPIPQCPLPQCPLPPCPPGFPQCPPFQSLPSFVPPNPGQFMAPPPPPFFGFGGSPFDSLPLCCTISPLSPPNVSFSNFGVLSRSCW